MKRKRQERVRISEQAWTNMSPIMRKHWKIRKKLFTMDAVIATMKARPHAPRSV